MSDSVLKVLVFTVLGGIGAFVGSLLGFPIGTNSAGFADSLWRVGVWDTFIVLGISIAFLLSQSWYLQRIQLPGKELAKIAGLSVIAGFAGGGILVIFRRVLNNFPNALSLIIAWGGEGLLIGLLIAPVIPNLPRRSALIAGGMAGVLGAIAMLGVNTIGIEGGVSVAVGDSLKGVFLGFLFTLTETLVREAWLEIQYAPKEIRTISLGATPISIGSDSNLATVYTANTAPVAFRYWLHQGQLLCEDVLAQVTRRVSDGDRQIVGKLTVTLRVAQSRQAGVQTEDAPNVFTPPQVPLSLYFKRQVFPLQVGTQLRSQEIPGLESQTSGVVAEVTRHPQEPTTLGLKNTSHQAWSATLATGEQKRIDPGRTIKLTPGTRIHFGAVEGEIRQ